MPKPDNINSYKDLQKLPLPKLREMGKADTEVANVTTYEKPELVDLLCETYGFEKPKAIKAAGMAKLKKAAKLAKKRRDELLATEPKARDQVQLTRARDKLKLLKRKMRKLAKAS